MDISQWLELRDIEKRSFKSRTWIPLRSHKQYVVEKEFGHAGYRKDVEIIESVVIFVGHRQNCEKLDWHGVSKTGVDRAWSDEQSFRPPGAFYDSDDQIIGFYPVLRKGFDTGEQTEWYLAQEIEFSLGLLRRKDVWVIPEEDYAEVVRLNRDTDGYPESLEIRAEHLRDYLCARKAAVLLTGFRYRDAIEEKLGDIPWQTGQERNFEGGEWKGIKRPILEGGRPVGSSAAILHMWRESVDPSDDVPIMPHPTEEPAARGTTRIVKYEGKQLEYAFGKIWWKQWIDPGLTSPRVANHEVEPQVPFIVGNQAGETLFGKALEDYGGWLWFRPGVIPALLDREAGFLEWHTQDTGSIGPAQNRTIHFGVNSVGLINGLAYKIGALPEWAQRIWSGFNVAPEGGLSEELHASQNLASPARSLAPEVMLWANLKAIQQLSLDRIGQIFFAELPTERNFFRRIHRFHEESFQRVCHLAKELIKIVVEPIEIDAVNTLLGSKAASLNKQLRSIKRLENWFTAHGEDGRKITGPLVGINDLRQGDAHSGESTARAALKILGIPDDADNYQQMNFGIIGSVAWTLGWIANTIDTKGAIQ